jgi:CheY-like chemotaxis protein
VSDATALVLVVDDDEDIRAMVTLVLQASGYRTLSAANGLEALALLHQHREVALVLLDIMMPHMAAPEFMRLVRGEPATAELPVVILSGDTGVKAHAAALRADHWMIKPIGVPELLSVAERFARPHAP